MGKSLQISNANNSSIEPVITISDIKNVGIGTTNPLHILDLGTSISSKKLALYNNNYNINGAAGFYGFGTGNATLDFHANSAENTPPQMVLKNGGNVGIGTTTGLESTLNVMVSDLVNRNALHLSSTDWIGGTDSVHIAFSHGATTTSNIRAKIGCHITQGGSSDLIFKTRIWNVDGPECVEKMRIMHNSLIKIP